MDVAHRLAWDASNEFWITTADVNGVLSSAQNSAHWILTFPSTVPAGLEANFAHGNHQKFKAMLVGPPKGSHPAVFLCKIETMLRNPGDGSGRISFKPIELYGYMNDLEYNLGLRKEPRVKRQRIPINTKEDSFVEPPASDPFTEMLIKYHTVKGAADITAKIQEDTKLNENCRNAKFSVKVIIERIA